MNELTRRRALKLAASTGIAAAAAVAGGQAAQAQEAHEGLRAQPPGPNDGIEVDNLPGPDIPSGQYGYAVVNSNGTLARAPRHEVGPPRPGAL